jgi:2,3-bisphosphoglycerate-dependent phosphoglycerate mutase
MQLYLIRHAESENNAKPLYARVEDPPITAVGRLQAGCLADWLATLKIDALLTSPVLRALQTTRYITKSTGQHVSVWADVYEEGGIYPGYGPQAVAGGMGLRRSDVIQRVADDSSSCTLDDEISESGWWGRRDRETPEKATARAIAVTGRLINTFGSRGETVLAVIHADFKRKLLTQMLGTTIDPRDFGFLRNTGITKLNFDGDRWQLDWFNSVSHLPAKLITGTES